LIAASERLKNAPIENLPAVEVINRYDKEDVFMYVDPPTFPERRNQTQGPLHFTPAL